MSIARRLTAPALALVLALGLAQAPAQADEAPRPRQARAKREVFPWAALAPVGLSAGYIYSGQGTKAVLAPLAVYALTFGGMVLAFSAAWDRGSWDNPVGSLVDIIVSPLAGAGLGFATGSAIVLVDQALTPHAGAPWVAPALSAGTVVLLIGTQVVLSDAGSAPFATPLSRPLADHRPGLALERLQGLAGGDDRTPQARASELRVVEAGAQ